MDDSEQVLAEEIAQRLRAERKRVGLTLQEAADICRVSRKGYANWEDPSKSATIQLIALLRLEHGGVDSLLVMKGESSVVELYDEISGSTALTPAGDLSQDEFTFIPRLNVEAAAGAGALVHDEQTIGRLAFRKDWLSQQHLSASDLRIMGARGDSMERDGGGISHGDMLLVSINTRDIVDDGVYVINFDHSLLVKRLQKDLEGGVLVLSDNPNYKPMPVSKNKLDLLTIVATVERVIHVHKP